MLQAHLKLTSGVLICYIMADVNSSSRACKASIGEMFSSDPVGKKNLARSENIGVIRVSVWAFIYAWQSYDFQVEKKKKSFLASLALLIGPQSNKEMMLLCIVTVTQRNFNVPGAVVA